MKFRDPKTGTVYDDIVDVVHRCCATKDCADCETCALGDELDWIREHPREAAEMMGFEVIENEPKEN